MWGLEKIADAFDKMHAEVQRDLDDALLVKNAQWYGKTFGTDSFLNWENAISAGITWSLATFIMGGRCQSGTRTSIAKFRRFLGGFGGGGIGSGSQGRNLRKNGLGYPRPGRRGTVAGQGLWVPRA